MRFLKGVNICIFKFEKGLNEILPLLNQGNESYIPQLMEYDIQDSDKKLFSRWAPVQPEGYVINTKTINDYEIRYVKAMALIEVSSMAYDDIIDPETDRPLPKSIRVEERIIYLIFTEINGVLYSIVSGGKTLESKIRSNLMGIRRGRESESAWGNVEFKEISQYTLNKSFYYWLLKNNNTSFNNNGKDFCIREVKGFKSNAERDAHSYNGEGSNIDYEIPLKTIIAMNEELISLYINILYDMKTYSFYLDYDGRLSLFKTECGEFSTQNPAPIDTDELLLTIYFDIIPFLKQQYNIAVNSGWAQTEIRFRKDICINAIIELMHENRVTLEELESAYSSI